LDEVCLIKEHFEELLRGIFTSTPPDEIQEEAASVAKHDHFMRMWEILHKAVAELAKDPPPNFSEMVRGLADVLNPESQG